MPPGLLQNDHPGLTPQPGYTPKPILFNEDDHYDFDKPWNKFTAATSAHASWGFLRPGREPVRARGRARGVGPRAARGTATAPDQQSAVGRRLGAKTPSARVMKLRTNTGRLRRRARPNAMWGRR